jgi:hypothetical protein
MQLTPELLLSIIKGLLAIIGAILTLFITMVGILHTGITKRLDSIEIDLKPFMADLARHGEQIKELEKDQDEMNKWLNNHDTRIQKLERTTKDQ